MMFSQKIAKIGKANSVDMFESVAGNFVIMISNNGTVKKNLTVSGTEYSLSGVQQRFIYKQMQHICDNLYLTKIDDNYAVIEVTDGL